MYIYSPASTFSPSLCLLNDSSTGPLWGMVTTPLFLSFILTIAHPLNIVFSLSCYSLFLKSLLQVPTRLFFDPPEIFPAHMGNFFFNCSGKANFEILAHLHTAPLCEKYSNRIRAHVIVYKPYNSLFPRCPIILIQVVMYPV